VNGVLFAAAVVFGFMLAEARVSRAHEQRLREAGAIAPPGDVYRAMAVLYPGAFLAMTIEGVWRAAAGPATSGGPAWPVAGVLLFAAGKALKVWAIRTLGVRWSFRVYVQAGQPLVGSGPYRYVAHPNYIAVVGELVGTAMMVGAVILGPIATAVFGVLLLARVRFEERALRHAVDRTPPA
jgi:methyltransferase